MTPYRAAKAIDKAFDEFAAVLAEDKRCAKNSLARFQGVGLPLRWDAWAWKKGDYEWWRRHDRAARALVAAETALRVLERLPYAARAARRVP